MADASDSDVMQESRSRRYQRSRIVAVLGGVLMSAGLLALMGHVAVAPSHQDARRGFLDGVMMMADSEAIPGMATLPPPALPETPVTATVLPYTPPVISMSLVTAEVPAALAGPPGPGTVATVEVPTWAAPVSPPAPVAPWAAPILPPALVAPWGATTLPPAAPVPAETAATTEMPPPSSSSAPASPKPVATTERTTTERTTLQPVVHVVPTPSPTTPANREVPAADTEVTTAEPEPVDRSTCSGAWDDCSKTGCCQDAARTCFRHDEYWSTCMKACDATAFSCEMVTPPSKKAGRESGRGENVMTAISEAPLLEWYTYRAVAEDAFKDYGFGDINTGNAQGVMWYLTNEVVTQYSDGTRCPRKFNISKIMRFKITSKATRELFEEGMNFGARFAYNRGICAGRCFDKNLCTGAADCEEHYSKYGQVLGCNNFWDLSAFPDYETSATNGVWYTFPGRGKCAATPPRGPIPTGAHDCTWSSEMAGEISLAEFEDATPADPGQGNCCGGRCSWAYDGGWMDTERMAARAQRLEDMFAKKYPSAPVLSEPTCDFNPWTWYDPDNWERTAGTL